MKNNRLKRIEIEYPFFAAPEEEEWVAVVGDNPWGIYDIWLRNEPNFLTKGDYSFYRSLKVNIEGEGYAFDLTLDNGMPLDIRTEEEQSLLIDHPDWTLNPEVLGQLSTTASPLHINTPKDGGYALSSPLIPRGILTLPTKWNDGERNNTPYQTGLQWFAEWRPDSNRETFEAYGATQVYNPYRSLRITGRNIPRAFVWKYAHNDSESIYKMLGKPWFARNMHLVDYYNLETLWEALLVKNHFYVTMYFEGHDEPEVYKAYLDDRMLQSFNNWISDFPGAGETYDVNLDFILTPYEE